MAEDNSVVVEPEKKKAPRKPIKKTKAIVASVIAVVVLACAGGGFWVFHETPEFCDFLCHNPQDPYNPTYYAQPGEAATDKWGNEVKDASGMMSAVHRVDADANCLSCHEPTLTEQVTEAMEWATGNFYNPLSERSLENLVRWHDGMEPTSFCLRPGCHDLTKETLTEKTADMVRNPHSWHHSEYTCSDCHKSHRASVMVCSQCHDDAEIPTGWLSWNEADSLGTKYLSYDQELVATGK